MEIGIRNEMGAEPLVLVGPADELSPTVALSRARPISSNGAEILIRKVLLASRPDISF